MRLTISMATRSGVSLLVFICFAVITVGFEQTFTSIDEDIGSFEICVRIFTDSVFFPIHISTNFSLNLNTIPGTAGMSHDHHVIFDCYLY